MFKVNIDKWLRRQMSATELALLREEDLLAESKMRVNAYRERLRRLNERANARIEEQRRAKLGIPKDKEPAAWSGKPSVVRRAFTDMLP